jgi:hypothetical protein
MQAGESDIMSEMAPYPHFSRLPHFGENDPSSKFASLHQTRCELISGFTQSRQARKGREETETVTR